MHKNKEEFDFLPYSTITTLYFTFILTKAKHNGVLTINYMSKTDNTLSYHLNNNKLNLVDL